MVRFIVTVSLLIALAAWNFPQFRQWEQHNHNGALLAQADPLACEDEAEKTDLVDRVAVNFDLEQDNAVETAAAAELDRPQPRRRSARAPQEACRPSR